MGNVFLAHNYAPVSEEHTITKLEVTGSIPEFLDGRYLRNGPNPLSEVDPAAYHWFMGDGMVHGVRLRDGKAEWYRNRWVRTPGISTRLGEQPRAPRPSKGLNGVGPNTNIISHAGKTLALIEGGVANYELTDELETVGPCDFDGSLPGGYTAHPKRDPETGELHAVSYFFGMGNHVQYSVIGADGRSRRRVDIEVGGSPMMHDFSLTEKHVVFYDLPVTFDASQVVPATVPRYLRTPIKLVVSALIGRVRIPDPIVARMDRASGSNARFPYAWNPKYPARIGVMPREGTAAEVRWFDVEPCYVFHPLNAYDDGDNVVLDVVRHPKMFDRDFSGLNEGPSVLHRWTVDLNAGKVREDQLDDHGQEFPRVDERLVGKQHRFGYSVTIEHGPGAGESLLKHDLVRGTTVVHTFGNGRQPGEFVFAPSHPDAAEDEGVLMGFVYDPTTQKSDLTLLDAATLDTVGAIHLPDRVPVGFHGNWAPNS
jgi:carotenoid cleavage dioxygenase